MKKVKKDSFSKQAEAGFTLTEMLLVFLIVGILSAIALPSWLGFISQQRVNVANEAVLRALQQTQQEAINKKRIYSVSFKSVSGQVPQFIIYPDSSVNTVPAATDSRWINLGEELGLKPRQFLLYSNIDPANANQKLAATTLVTGVRTIRFDFTGILRQPPYKDNTGLKFMVAAPLSNSSTQPLETTKQCVVVQTLLGAMRTAKKTACND